jgi:hypothetical protein
MIATITLSVVIAILILLTVAHLAARRDDREFTAPRGRRFDYEKQIIYMDEDQPWKSSTTVKFDFKKQKPKQKQTLQQKLKAALKAEDYMLAAKLRDQINATEKTK